MKLKRSRKTSDMDSDAGVMELDGTKGKGKWSVIGMFLICKETNPK